MSVTLITHGLAALLASWLTWTFLDAQHAAIVGDILVQQSGAELVCRRRTAARNPLLNSPSPRTPARGDAPNPRSISRRDLKTVRSNAILLPLKRSLMLTLAKQVLEHAAGLPEGTPLIAKELLHLGSRAAVDQVLSRLVRRGALLRASRGIYVVPVESRFGSRAPSTAKMVEGLASRCGETIVSHGASAANALARIFREEGVGSLVPKRVAIGISPPMPTEDCRCQSVRTRSWTLDGWADASSRPISMAAI